MRVQLPRQLREQIENAIAPVIKAAQAAYRRLESLGRTVPAPQQKTKMDRSADRTDVKPGARVVPTAGFERNAVQNSSGEAGHGRLWTMEELRARLEHVATVDERPIVRAVLERLSSEKAASTQQSAVNDVVVDLNRMKRQRRSLRYGSG
jgi:hypothetical protein